MTVDELIAAARGRGIDRLDAQLLVAHVIGRGRAWQLAHGDAPVGDVQTSRLLALLERRAAGEPLAYLVGEKEFHGLTLRVDSRVLVPRPETELLVDWAVELLGGRPVARPRVVDLGTGSGAIALAVKHAVPEADVLAVDASAAALEVARANAARLGLALRFEQGSWWQGTAGGQFALALANPPYIAAGDRHLAALGHEPRGALTPGESGLEALAEIITGAPAHLHTGAWLLLEHGHDQAEAVRAMLAERGFRELRTRLDLAGLPRCTGGRTSTP